MYSHHVPGAFLKYFFNSMNIYFVRCKLKKHIKLVFILFLQMVHDETRVDLLGGITKDLLNNKNKKKLMN